MELFEKVKTQKTESERRTIRVEDFLAVKN